LLAGAVERESVAQRPKKDLTRKTFLLSSWVPRVSILRPGKRAKRAAQRALPVDPLVLLREE
jgi:hypothetical protein